jgi:nucleoid-associated protein YgaU
MRISKPTPGYNYTVQKGDTLRSIAQLAYGDDSRPAWEGIYNENREVIRTDPYRIQPGQVLSIPPLNE